MGVPRVSPLLRDPGSTRSARAHRTSIHSQTGKRLFEQCAVNAQTPPIRFHVLKLIKGAKQAQLDRAILLGIIQRTPVRLAPCRQRALRQKDANGIRQLPVGRHIKHKLRGRCFPIVRQGGALTHEVVLVHVTLRAGGGLESATRHADIMELVAASCLALSRVKPGHGSLQDKFCKEEYCFNRQITSPWSDLIYAESQKLSESCRNCHSGHRPRSQDSRSRSDLERSRRTHCCQ